MISQFILKFNLYKFTKLYSFFKLKKEPAFFFQYNDTLNAQSYLFIFQFRL